GAGRDGTVGARIVGFQPHEGKRSLGLENVGRLKTPIVGFEYLAEDRLCSHLLFCFESREKVFAPFNSDVLNDEVGPLEEVVWIPSLASVTLHRLVDGAHKRVGGPKKGGRREASLLVDFYVASAEVVAVDVSHAERGGRRAARSPGR